MNNIIEMNHISRYFSVNDTQALFDMSLSVKRGEIHAIVGENGAGKSTLMKILHNIERSDSGEIHIGGVTGMVSQHFRLVDTLSILDNIIIGQEPVHAGFINRKQAEREIEEILKVYGFSIDIHKLVSSLSIGQKQLVEILKVIYNNSDILILDEPTSALSDIEAIKLRKTLLSLKERGKTIIIISHKIKDIASISDRFTIMRKGRYIETVETHKVNMNEISKHMSGTEIIEPLIETDSIKGDIKFRYRFRGREIVLHESEVIGITGYGDCGLHELERELEEFAIKDTTIGYVPSDRLNRGVELNSPLKETLIARKRDQFQRFGWLNTKKIDNYAKVLIEKLNIQGSINCQTGTLSGGNLQKSVLARVLDQNPETLILCSPTWGIDIESANRIYSDINNQKKSGGAILLLSSDVEEVLKLSNRVFILYKGEIIKELKNDEHTNTEYIGRLSSGIIDE